MAAPLYQLARNYQNIWDLVDDDTMDLDILEQALQSVEGEIQEKAHNIASLLRTMDYQVDAIKQEEKRLAERRKAIENRQAHLKTYIQQQLEAAGITKVKTPTFTIGIQNNPPAVEILDQGAIPERFLVVIPEQRVPDKKGIAEALKAGEEVSGAALRIGKSLRIR